MTDCDASGVVPWPSMPEPSDSRLTVAVPDLTPDVLVLIPTTRLALLVSPAPRPVNDPVAVIGLAALTLPSSASE